MAAHTFKPGRRLVFPFFFLLLMISMVSAAITGSPTVTSPPTAPSTGVPEALIGSEWQNAFNASTTWFCYPGSTWSTIGTYAACCTTDKYQACIMPTACSNTSILVGVSQTSTCSGTGSQTHCVSGTIYDAGNTTRYVVNRQCWLYWDGSEWNATRAYTEGTHKNAATKDHPGPNLSGGAIAGIVVAAVFGLVLIVGAVVLCLHLHKRKERNKSKRRQTMSTANGVDFSIVDLDERNRQFSAGCISELDGKQPPTMMDIDTERCEVEDTPIKHVVLVDHTRVSSRVPSNGEESSTSARTPRRGHSPVSLTSYTTARSDLGGGVALDD